jgi:hypothetical protein
MTEQEENVKQIPFQPQPVPCQVTTSPTLVPVPNGPPLPAIEMTVSMPTGLTIVYIHADQAERLADAIPAQVEEAINAAASAQIVVPSPGLVIPPGGPETPPNPRDNGGGGHLRGV